MSSSMNGPPAAPLHYPHVRDRILEFVGPKHFRSVRAVCTDWNASAVRAFAASPTAGPYVHLTPDNMEEYCDSKTLLRPTHAATPSRPRLRVALDFGRGPTRSQFAALLHSVRSHLLPLDGRSALTQLRFGGGAPSFTPTLQEWDSLFQLLQELSPNLRLLSLFDPGWKIPDGTFLHPHHYTATEEGRRGYAHAFPRLEELIFCWQEPNRLLLETLLHPLEPVALPCLCRLEISVIDAGVPFYSLGLMRVMKRLAEPAAFPFLKQLTLTLDWSVTSCLGFSDAQLLSLHRLVLHILPNTAAGAHVHGDGHRHGAPYSGMDGSFIHRMFPELRDLELHYSAVPHSSWVINFPWNMGTLVWLESLTYRLQLQHGMDGFGVHELRMESGSANFPNLGSVTTDFGFELHGVEYRTGTPQALQFPTVYKLEVRLGDPEPHGEEQLERLASALHSMYPTTTCLSIWSPMSDAATAAARVLIRAFGGGVGLGLEELCIRGVGMGGSATGLLSTVMEDPGVRRVLQQLAAPLRRLKLEAGPGTGGSGGSSLTLTRMVATFPSLELLEVDDRLVRVWEEDDGAVEGTEAVEACTGTENVYVEAAALQRKNPKLNIRLN